MTLLIDDREVNEVLPMEQCITAMEVAFGEFASGIAVNRPRLRYKCPSIGSQTKYFANIHGGAVPGYGVAALRVDSALWLERVVNGVKRAGRHLAANRSWDFVLLYSLETAEPLAIIHGFSLSGIRVAATSAVAVKQLAREDAETLGLLGTGKQAKAHLEAISKVRTLREVKVYSPSEEHRRNFSEEMSKVLLLDVQPENGAESVVRGSDIICCATSSLEPVFNGKWLTKGQIVITIGNTDVTVRRTEADETTFTASDLIVINDKESVFTNQQVELLEPIENGLFTWDKVSQLGDILIGSASGRSSPDQLIYYKNNTGLAVQFAASGAVVYREALRRRRGKELPTEWFGADLSQWHDQGYYPHA